MSQVYHSREIIQKSNLTNVELAKNYNLNVKTISKLKHRKFIEDKSSRPYNIKIAIYRLSLIKIRYNLIDFKL